MNCEQAKQRININNFVQSYGIKPVKKIGNITWYLSPFRKEKSASFKTNEQLNTWYDFGSSEGGTIIDLTTKLFNCDIKEALSILSGNTGIINPVATQNKPKLSQQKTFHILEIKPLNNPALIQYLQSRKINIEIAKLYLQEMYYSYGDKSFFGLCFSNDSKNGYEIRNPMFKGFIGETKTITTINERENNNLAIFEGYLDFLAYLTHIGKQKLESTCIILNGASLLLEAIEKIKSGTYSKIYLFLDNDQTGNEITQTISETFNNIQVLDKSEIYSGFKDMNEFLMKKYGCV